VCDTAHNGVGRSIRYQHEEKTVEGAKKVKLLKPKAEDLKKEFVVNFEVNIQRAGEEV
jgi:hypothetical protein